MSEIDLTHRGWTFYQAAQYRILRSYKVEAYAQFGKGSPSRSPKLLWDPDRVKVLRPEGRSLVQIRALIAMKGALYLAEDLTPLDLQEGVIYVFLSDVLESIKAIMHEVKEQRKEWEEYPRIALMEKMATQVCEEHLIKEAGKMRYEIYKRRHIKGVDFEKEALAAKLTPGALARCKCSYFNRLMDLMRRGKKYTLEWDEELRLMSITRELCHHIRVHFGLRLRDHPYAY